MPSRSGHTFVGWYNTSAQTGGTRFTSSSTVPNSTLNLWARWRQDNGNITIFYHGGGHTGGTVPSRQDVSTPGLVFLRSQGSMTRAGYSFAGWRDGSGQFFQAGQQMSWNTAVNGTVNLTAVWTRNTGTITITYAGNGHTGGIVPSRQDVTTPGSVHLRSQGSMVRAGHTFGGWRQANGIVLPAGYRFDWTSAVSGTIPLTAVWIPNTGTLTLRYFSTGHTGTLPQSHNVTTPGATNVALQGNLLRAGYNFGGWQATDGRTFVQGQRVTWDTVVSGNFDLTAVWNRQITPLTTVRLHGNGGNPALTTLPGKLPGSIIQRNEVPIPSNSPNRIGYRFDGWFNTAGVEFAEGFVIPQSATPIDFTARWELNTVVRLTFMYNDGTPRYDWIQRQAEVAVGLLPRGPNRLPTHEFRGWFTLPSGGSRLTTTCLAPRINTTYWAQWDFIAAPTILHPATNGEWFTRQNLDILWERVPGVTHRLTLINLTTNETLINGLVVSGSSHTIPQNLLTPDHNYRVTIAATSGGQTTQSHRTFFIEDICDFFRFYGELGFLFPLPYSRHISSGFRDVRHDIHQGLDLVRVAGDSTDPDLNQIRGEAVFAAHDGLVMRTGYDSTGGGYRVTLQSTRRSDDTRDFIVSRYMHLLRPTSAYNSHLLPGIALPEPNQVIPIGTQIGGVGNTGQSSNYHLHLDFNNRGLTGAVSASNAMNPERFFPNITFTGASNRRP